MDGGCTAEMSFNLGGFGRKDMSLKRLTALNCATGSYSKALCGTFLGLHFRHFEPFSEHLYCATKVVQPKGLHTFKTCSALLLLLLQLLLLQLQHTTAKSLLLPGLVQQLLLRLWALLLP